MHPPESSCDCANGTACDNAQACYWYSQGCSIGCPECDSVNGRAQIDICGAGKNATILEPLIRTVNRAAEAMTEYDVYRHNPWRAPGTAPVVDACGMAGGAPTKGVEWADYIETPFAKQGDKGSEVLPCYPTDTKWKRGDTVEATWQVTANHGGGYQYRLCPLTEALTEDCFMTMPVPFAGKTFLEWGYGSELPRLEINGTFVSEGTVPEGSTWAANPIPARCLSGECAEGKPCEPLAEGEVGTPCDDTPDPAFEPPCEEGDTPGLCSGNQPNGGVSVVSVVDTLVVPDGIEPGQYVLGWRWDCEATAQVWNSCADITIV